MRFIDRLLVFEKEVVRENTLTLSTSTYKSGFGCLPSLNVKKHTLGQADIFSIYA